MSRVVYNRIGKAGSTAMTALIYILSKLNNFQILQEYNFYPSKEYLINRLTNLPNNTIYINHCHYIKNLPSDIQWINIMREPIEREQSIFYYDVRLLYIYVAYIYMYMIHNICYIYIGL